MSPGRAQSRPVEFATARQDVLRKPATCSVAEWIPDSFGFAGFRDDEVAQLRASRSSAISCATSLVGRPSFSARSNIAISVAGISRSEVSTRSRS